MEASISSEIAQWVLVAMAQDHYNCACANSDFEAVLFRNGNSKPYSNGTFTKQMTQLSGQPAHCHL